MLSRFAALSLAVALVTGFVGCSKSPTENNAATKPAAPTTAELAKQHAEAGKRFAGEQHYEQAIDEFTKALNDAQVAVDSTSTVSPDAEVLFERGMAYLAMGFPDTAAEDFSAVIQQRHNYGPAYAKRAQCYVELRDSYRGLRDSTSAIRFEPACAEGYRTRGVAYRMRGQFDRAVADMEQAVKIDPTLEPAIKPQLAEIYGAWGEHLAIDDDAAAATKFAKARELNPGIVLREHPTELAKETESVEVTAAKPVLDEALDHFEKGRTLQNQQKYDAALIEFTEAMAIHRDMFDAYIHRGQTLMALGFADTALKDFDDAIKYDDRSAEAYRLEAEALFQMKSYYRTMLAATDSLHRDPSVARTYAIRGEAYVALGNWESALADLNEAVRREPALKDELEPTLAEAYRLRDEAQRKQREQAAGTTAA